MSELRSCPFCGNHETLFIRKRGGKSTGKEIHCKRCLVTVNFGSDLELIKKWSMRFTDKELTTTNHYGKSETVQKWISGEMINRDYRGFELIEVEGNSDSNFNRPYEG